MDSVTNPLMDSEMWGANLAGKYVVCRSDKAFTPHPTISAVPLPDAALTRLIRPTFRFGRCQRITRHCVARPAGRCCHNVLSLRSSRTSLPSEVLILFRPQKAKNQPVGWFF